MKFFEYDKLLDSFNLSMEVAKALDRNVVISDISDTSGYYDLCFTFNDGTIAFY